MYKLQFFYIYHVYVKSYSNTKECYFECTTILRHDGYEGGYDLHVCCFWCYSLGITINICQLQFGLWPVGGRRITRSVFLFLSVCPLTFHKQTTRPNFLCYLWPWLGPVLTIVVPYGPIVVRSTRSVFRSEVVTSINQSVNQPTNQSIKCYVLPVLFVGVVFSTVRLFGQNQASFVEFARWRQLAAKSDVYDCLVLGCLPLVIGICDDYDISRKYANQSTLPKCPRT